MEGDVDFSELNKMLKKAVSETLSHRPKKQTNADRIRAMSDAELEEFIVDLNRHCLAGPGKVDCSAYKYCEGNCEKVVSKWLREEAE